MDSVFLENAIQQNKNNKMFQDDTILSQRTVLKKHKRANFHFERLTRDHLVFNLD